jgi:DNA (cytosine-5)-methyltransferase 1
MKVAGLFAGIGGLELGLANAGHTALLLCENWEPAAAVLSHRFPDVPKHGDIRGLLDLPTETELLCAGFPCQDLSQAGRTAGIAGARSGLVGEVFRLLEFRRVPWLLLENVPFMLQLDRGRALHSIVSELERLRYRWAYRVLDTLAFGVPQRRHRVFLLASIEGDPADILLADDTVPPKKRTTLKSHAHGFYWTEGTRGLGWAPDAIPTLKNGSTIGIPSPPAILLPNGNVIKPDIRDAERLQGFEVDWTRPAERVGRPSLRWSLVGNSISVPVAEWLGRKLNAYGRYDAAHDRDLPFDGRWPNAARYDGARRRAVAVSTSPCWIEHPPLHEFLQFEGTPLSVKATAGFLRRADASPLRFVHGFKDALRAHLRTIGGDQGGEPVVTARDQSGDASEPTLFPAE